MHISEGVLSPAMLALGGAVAVAGTAVGLKKIDYDQLPGTAMLAACFFVASLIHVPVGPASAHLILNGLLGILLGWAAFPAILVALVLQGVLFQFGGLVVLGANTTIMALPAVLVSLALGGMIRSASPLWSPAAFLAGAGSVLLSGLTAAGFLALTGDPFLPAAKLLVAAHIPIMLIEGIIAMTAVRFIRKVRPEMLRMGTAGQER